MNTSRPTLSVVIATFNGEKFIDDQLHSILSQTRLPDEIVVSDDGSTDDTLEIIRTRQRQAPPEVSWQFLKGDAPLGPAHNFLRGVRAARGDLIALSDQDDWWFPKKLATLEKVLLADPGLLLVHSDAELVDESGALTGVTLSESLRMTAGERRGLRRGRALRQLVRRNLVTGHTVVMKKQVVDMAGHIPEGWLHDEWWALIAAAHGGVVFYPGVLGHYRQHAVNQVGASRSGVAEARARFHETQEEFRRRHATRHEGLAAFLAEAGSRLPESSRALLAGRMNHYAWQASLPRAKMARAGKIAGRFFTGDYRRYRRGLFDALRDLMQPSTD